MLVSDAVVEAGAVVSTVTVSVLALDCTLPAASVCVKLKMYTPSASAALLAPSGVHVTALPVPVMLASPPFRVNALPSFVTVTATVDPLSAVTPSTGATLVTRSPLVPESVLVSDAVVEVGAVLSTVNALAELVVVTFPATSVSTIVYVTAPFPVRFATVPVHEAPLPVRVTVGVPAPLNVTTGATDRLSLDVTLIVTDALDANGPVPDDPSRNVTALAVGAVLSTVSVDEVPVWVLLSLESATTTSSLTRTALALNDVTALLPETVVPDTEISVPSVSVTAALVISVVAAVSEYWRSVALCIEGDVPPIVPAKVSVSPSFTDVCVPGAARVGVDEAVARTIPAGTSNPATSAHAATSLTIPSITPLPVSAFNAGLSARLVPDAPCDESRRWFPQDLCPVASIHQGLPEISTDPVPISTGNGQCRF